MYYSQNHKQVVFITDNCVDIDLYVKNNHIMKYQSNYH